MKTTYVAVGLTFSLGLILSACQTPQSRQAELAQICANPVNRATGSFYYGECQSLYPSTDRRLQRNYRLGAPTGN
ncbi:hypothetical protein [Bosea sp. NBC_00550]|uniref:hypothetical protein n=1 Tax=Bosea sp. NBC_00550 TaxID=2969621 RepID=UPI0022313EDD|nr:hypothetical protein [Bosea sp. NBC_00550]UZF92113.1 hypothetical protein NWE53_24070 [Bosea sp. NBC_00550]